MEDENNFHPLNDGLHAGEPLDSGLHEGEPLDVTTVT